MIAKNNRTIPEPFAIKKVEPIKKVQPSTTKKDKKTIHTAEKKFIPLPAKKGNNTLTNAMTALLLMDIFKDQSL